MSAKSNWRARARCPYFRAHGRDSLSCLDPLNEESGSAVLKTGRGIAEEIFEIACCGDFEYCPIYRALTKAGGYEDQ